MPPVGKIAALPDEIRRWLREAIVDRSFGDIGGLTEELNELLRQAGAGVTVGRSAVGEESRRVKRAQEAIRATTEAAKLIAATSRDDADDRSAASMALVQSETFRLLLDLLEANDEDADPVERLKVMGKVSKSLAELSRARVNQAKWATDVEARAKLAADRTAKLCRQGGMSEATVNEIRASILGIAQRTAPAA